MTDPVQERDSMLLEAFKKLIEESEERTNSRMDAKWSLFKTRQRKSGDIVPTAASKSTNVGDMKVNQPPPLVLERSPAPEISDGQGGQRPPCTKKSGGGGGRRSSRSPSDGRFDRLEVTRHPDSVIRQVFSARRVDNLRFRTVEPKLESHEGYTSWKRKVLSSIDEQQCSFVLNPDERAPDCFVSEEIPLVTKKVKYFLESSMDDYYVDLLQELDHPRDMMSKLAKTFEPTSIAHVTALVDQFNSMYHDQNAEKAVEFVTRFTRTLRNLYKLNPEMMNEQYVRQTFIAAIRDSTTYARLEYSSGKPSLQEIQDMLIEAESKDEQISALPRGGKLGAMFVGGPKRTGTPAQATKAVRGRGRGVQRSSQGDFRGKPYKQQGLGKSGGVGKGTNPKRVCTHCNKTGHTIQRCFKLKRKCYVCDQSGHLASDCPKSTSMPSVLSGLKTPAQMRYAKAQAKRLAQAGSLVYKRPQTFKTNLGKAKAMAESAKLDKNVTFAIMGPTEGPDNMDVWVAVGEPEQGQQDSVNFVTEQVNAALTTSEGKSKIYVTMVVDTGATEHLATSMDCLTNVISLQFPRVFKCANENDDANLVVAHKGEIQFLNNSRQFCLRDVLYAPGLTTNLFSVRKVTNQGMKVIFTKDSVKFINDTTGEIIKTGYFKDNLWWVDFELPSPALFKRTVNLVGPTSKKPKLAVLTASDESNPRDVLVGGSALPESPEPSTSESMGGSTEESGEEVRICNSPQNLDTDLRTLDMSALESQFKPSLKENLGALWHLRLNHASKRYLELASKLVPEMKGLRVGKEILECVECALANTSRKPHNTVRTRADRPFAVLHSDLMGAIRPANFRTGARYIVTFTCDYSRFAFAYAIGDKKQVHLAFSKCLDEIARILKARGAVISIRTDGGREYQTTEMKRILQKESVQLFTSPPATPQLNGCAERFNRVLTEKIRVNLLSAKMPFSFWSHALNYVVHVHNRMPNASNEFVSPFELVHGRAPSLKYIKRFGCLAAAVDKNPKPKFAPNARRTYILECDETGYVLFDELHKTLVRSGDVKCIETHVYGDHIKDYPKPLADALELCSSECGNVCTCDGSHSEEGDLPSTSEAALYVEPSSFSDAVASHESDLWEQAMLEELQAHEENGTWRYAPKSTLAPRTKIIKARWVHKRKNEPDGSFRYKSRLVAKGFADSNFYDESEIFAPVSRLVDVRLVLSLANKLNLYLTQLDVKTAFLYGELEKVVYMDIPEGVVELTDVPGRIRETHVCELVKSLYGLKVSPKLW